MRDINDLQFENLSLSRMENKNIAQKLIDRIDNVKTIAGTQANMDNPYASVYPSLVSNEPLKDAQDYILNFQGNIDRNGNPNISNVIHMLGGNIYTQLFVIPRLTGNVGGYLVGEFSWVTINSDNVYYAIQSYVGSVTMTFQVCVTGAVSAPIVAAYAVEAKGATGYTLRSLSTYFEASDQNTQTQYIKEKQILSNDRAVVIITQPQQLSIILKPFSK